MRIRHFKAEGYRNVLFDEDLASVNVLVGPNNSGKSNLLRALGFWADYFGSNRPLKDIAADHGGPGLHRRGSR